MTPCTYILCAAMLGQIPTDPTDTSGIGIFEKLDTVHLRNSRTQATRAAADPGWG